MVHWLGLHTLTAEGLGSVPAQEAKSHNVVWLKQKMKKQDILEQNIAVLTLTGFESRMI